MGSPFDLIELSRQLKQERLFINCERDQLHQLNSEVCKTAESLYCLSWITRQQKANLSDLVRAAREVTPVECCQKGNSLETVKFIDGYKVLTYHEAKIGETLKALRADPKLVAMVLIQAEKEGVEQLQYVAHVIMSGVYGNTVMQEDETLVLQVLKCLIELQLAVHENPRRLLRKASSAFGVFFKLFIEGLFSARLFLTAALHKPVMQLLMEDEWFYDIDPQRALHRFPPDERKRRFGSPETPEYLQKTEHYRGITATKLMTIADRFINSIKNNMYCFPHSLCWLVSQLCSIVTSGDCVAPGEARALCADLVLALFICPAICDPEPLGITSDAPISYRARHNLMQVAQILQVLAISTPDDVELRQTDLYSKFDKECMVFLLNGLLNNACVDLPSRSGNNSEMIQRTAMYMTMSELRRLLSALRTVLEVSGDESAAHKRLTVLLSSVPTDAKLEEMQNKRTPNTTPHGTPPGTPSSSKKKFKAKDRQARLKNLLTADRYENGYQSDPEMDRPEAETEDVILVSLGVINECPGMESEQKIVEQEHRQRKSRYNSLVPGEDDPISESEILANEKRTRFSLSHDQDSIATSDNLEAISEAASSHSVGSDIENDNLSDMVSANVSGRGTPSISGRDTPLSQATCETDSQMEGQAEERRTGPDLPVTVHKNNREDVTDKFQKFEIEREEIKSTVSDTWSTDVLASDSEPPEQNQMERLDEIAEEMVRQNLLGVQMQEACEETASDAWSTDVLASDTSELQVERLLELEQEEVSSVSSRSQHQDEADSSVPVSANEHTPQPSSPHSSVSEDRRISADFGGDSAASGMGDVSAEIDDALSENNDTRDPFTAYGPNDDQKLPAEPYSDATLTVFSGTDMHRRDKKNKRHSAGNQPRLSNDDIDLDVRQNTFVHSSKGVFRQVGSQEENEDSVSASRVGGGGGNTGLAWDETPLGVADGGRISMEGSTNSGRISMEGSTNSGRISMEGSTNSGHISMEGSTNSVDSVASQMSTGLKLTEYQNINIDAKRLSSTVVDVFDPLAPPPAVAESHVNQHDWNQSESRKLPYNLNNKQTSQNKGNYVEQGARPKIMVNSQNIAPRIQLQPNESKENNKLSQQGSRGISQSVRFDPKLSETGGINVESAKLKQDHGALISFGSDDIGVLESTVKRKSSWESSSSPASDGGAVLIAAGAPSDSSTPQIITTEASPIRHEYQFNDDKNTTDKKRSYGSNIFKSFKDKITKGSVGMAGHRQSGKQRKTLKSYDKEEKGVAVLVEIDRGGDVGGARNGHVSDSNDDPFSKHRFHDSSAETSDDILAKYRKPVSSSSPRKNNDVTEGRGDGDDVDRGAGRGSAEEPPAYDPSNLENCRAFLDAKKKLRLVLSTADFQAISLSAGGGGVLGSSPLTIGGEKKENELVSFLKAQLAEAINLQDKDLIARLHETIRCLTVFNNYETKKLLKSIREEHRSRSPYTSYLIRCRQGLLGTQSHLERLLNRIQRDKTIVNKYFLAVNVRMFLEKREQDLVRFIQNFQEQALSDEKTDFVEEFLRKLHAEMNNDPLWQMARREQVEQAKVYIERNVMGHIYTHAMYPNGDGDMARDQILYEHMKKLAQVITPNHQDLRIPRMYHYECPWPAAQNEIYMINAYKTPKDKLQCVLRCSSTIMNLLSLANEKSVPAADDFMPVLIFVLIKANPPSLLSTVQYVNSFYEKRLYGEEQYWWMQFTSAIVFIKTMDYDR